MDKIDFALIGLLITSLLGLASLIVSIFSLRISKANRRNSQLNRLHERQFEFFLKVEDHIAKINNLLTDNIKNIPSLVTDLSNIIDDFYTLISQNEIIIPDDLYHELNDYYHYCSQIDDKLTEDVSNLTKELTSNFIAKTINFENEIRVYFKIEELSDENKKLVRKR